MNSTDRHQKEPSAWDLWRRNGIVWLALLGLLALTWGLAYVPLGSFNLPISLVIALVKAGLVAILFMELKESSALNRLVVTIGLLMLVTLFTLTSADVVTRVLNGWRQ
jgi:cytochrome c oxidase subunit 4